MRMKFHTLLALSAAVLLATSALAGQAKPAAKPATPAAKPAAAAPAAPAAPAKFVPPIRGEAPVSMTKPVVKRLKDEVITTFKVKNTGAVEHELVVVSTPPGAYIPTKPDGSVDESQIPTGTEKGRIDLLARKSASLRLAGLAPGSYTLFCNLETPRSDGTSISHYKLGMHTTFKVG